MYNSPYSSCFQCAHHLYKTEGPRAFYRSYTTQMAMNLPHHVIVIIMYEKMQQVFNKSKKYNPLAHCIAGAFAGAVGAAITTPLDVCKTLLNTQETSTLNQLHKSQIIGIRNAFTTIRTLLGYRGFFRGWQARIMYQMPSTAISWTIYELFKHYLLKADNEGASNPEQGSELLKDGVLPATHQLPDHDGGGGWGGGGTTKAGPVVQEKRYHGLTPPGTVERLRTLHVSSPLTASCSAASPDENLLGVK